MKFLADAHISVELVEMIRSLGHDCLDAAAIPPRMLHVDALQRAAERERVRISSDKDFGELVFICQIELELFEEYSPPLYSACLARL